MVIFRWFFRPIKGLEHLQQRIEKINPNKLIIAFLATNLVDLFLTSRIINEQGFETFFLKAYLLEHWGMTGLWVGQLMIAFSVVLTLKICQKRNSVLCLTAILYTLIVILYVILYVILIVFSEIFL